MKYSFKKKIIAVTGAANGIGRAAAILLAKEGATIIAIDKEKKSLDKLKLKLKNKCILKNINCTNLNEIKTNLKDIKIIDGLVNCAGIVHQGDMMNCSENDWDHTLNTNLTSVFYISQYFMKIFLKRKKGSIVNISSVASSIKGVKRRFAYSTSKAGIIGLTKSIAVDYAKKGIRCNVICPGTVDTPTWRKRVLSAYNPSQARKDFNSRQIIGRVAKPEEISDLILFLLSDRSSFVTGSIYNIDGGMSL
ncbi:MAG: SDR family oxidoreductase [Alphaproteobacteria bacterium]|tara:strand:- start:958 stop:1704 length:747 start_codon:yes stop_codon:yes gene_type:complete